MIIYILRGTNPRNERHTRAYLCKPLLYNSIVIVDRICTTSGHRNSSNAVTVSCPDCDAYFCSGSGAGQSHIDSLLLSILVLLAKLRFSLT